MLCGLCLFDSLGLCWRHGNRGWLSSLVPSVIWYPTDVGEEELPQRKSSFYPVSNPVELWRKSKGSVPSRRRKGCPVLIFSYFHRVAVDAEEAGAIVLKTREVATDRLYVPEGTACGRFRLGSESGWGEAELAFEGAIKSRL